MNDTTQKGTGASAQPPAKPEEKKQQKAIVKSPSDEIALTLRGMEDQFKIALPPTMRSEHFVRVLVTHIRTAKNHALENIGNKSSLYSEAMKAAQDGLLLDGREAALIPYGANAKYMPMVAGMCKRARNSGEVTTIDAQIVYDNDEWKYWIDEKGTHFEHIPADEPSGKIRLAYAYCHLKDGSMLFERMTPKELDAIEAQSAGAKAKDSPYNGAFRSEMQRKAPLRRLLKYRAPSSADVADVLARDNELYDMERRVAEAKPVNEPTKGKRTRISKIVEAAATREPDDASEQPEPKKDEKAKGSDEVPI